jgi:predicted lipoprotein with Yx(FWY)xxD motif
VAQAQTAATVNVSAHASLGDILTDGDTLYLFTNDERDKSNCSGGCAGAWPPLMTTGDPVPGEGVNEGRLGTITRDDDSTQVTFNGWPLYYYAADEAAGDANGQDRGGVWFVVSTAGGPIQTSAIVNLTARGSALSLWTTRAVRSTCSRRTSATSLTAPVAVLSPGHRS